jgi:hypothetical protein
VHVFIVVVTRPLAGKPPELTTTSASEAPERGLFRFRPPTISRLAGVCTHGGKEMQ